MEIQSDGLPTVSAEKAKISHRSAHCEKIPRILVLILMDKGKNVKNS